MKLKWHIRFVEHNTYAHSTFKVCFSKLATPMQITDYIIYFSIYTVCGCVAVVCYQVIVNL